MKKSLGWAGLALATALPLALACSAGRSPDIADSGIRAGDDSGSAPRDAGASSDAAGDAPLGAQPDAGVEADETDPGAYAAACLDGRDQNSGGGLDCSDLSCGRAASCCVGVASADCCRFDGTSVSRTFACTTGTCDDLTGFTTFGDVGPVRTSDMAYAPESDHGTDSGAILDVPLDPRAARIAVSATLGVPDTTAETDAVGVGLVAGGPSAHVVPLAAVVVSAARQQVLLLLGESVAAAAPLAAGGEMRSYTLAIDPSGAVSVRSDGVSLDAHVAIPAGTVRAAFFGRATNPSSGSSLPARIGALDVASAGCDQPTALTRLDALTIVDHTSAALLATATDPTVAASGTTQALAFSARAMGGPTGIFVAVLEGDGAYHVRAPAGGTQPVLAPAAGDALESPALAVDGAGHWTMYATRVRAGARSIVRAESSGTDVLTWGAPLDVSTSMVGDVGSPAPVPGHPDQLVVRHHGPPSGGDVTETVTELVLLELASSGAAQTPSAGICGADANCAPDTRVGNRLYATRTGTIAFDADDVDDPAIVFYDHVYRLYYAGRLGSRWSIGMLIAADLGYWRPANEGAPVLSPDGTGLDAVSVRAPAPFVVNDQLELFYVGSDGDVPTIASARGGSVAITP